MVAAMPQRAVIIDTDPGTDDAVELWLALAAPELDVRLVTVAGGNVGLDRPDDRNACASVVGQKFAPSFPRVHRANF